MEFAYKCAICGWGIFTDYAVEIKYCPRRNCRALIFKNAPKKGLRNANFEYRNNQIE